METLMGFLLDKTPFNGQQQEKQLESFLDLIVVKKSLRGKYFGAISINCKMAFINIQTLFHRLY